MRKKDDELKKRKKEREALKKFAELKPFNLRPGTEKLSEQIDDILYGEKDAL